MLAGTKERFAIEAEPEAMEGNWIFGRFRFWICGREVGDWNDCTALQYCVSWLKEFAQAPSGRVEASVVHRSPGEIFELIVTPAIGPRGIADPRRQPIPFAYERFHITHIGMSSFDNFVIILVKDTTGDERCLWQKHGEEQIYDCWFSAGEMERVALEFCNMFEAQFRDHPFQGG